MAWKYDDERCVCEEKSEEHVSFDRNLNMDVRRRRKEKINAGHTDVYDMIKNYESKMSV